MSDFNGCKTKHGGIPLEMFRACVHRRPNSVHVEGLLPREKWGWFGWFFFLCVSARARQGGEGGC